MEFERRSRLRPRLSVAPLVDVVFLLLIFFLLTSSFDKREAMQLDLPTAQSGPPVEEAAIRVSLSADGSTQVNGRSVPAADLKAELERRLDAGQVAAAGVHLRADREVPVGELVRVMDAVRQAGGHALSLATISPAPPSAASPAPADSGPHTR